MVCITLFWRKRVVNWFEFLVTEQRVEGNGDGKLKKLEDMVWSVYKGHREGK
jgi:hypothetical protein